MIGQNGMFIGVQVLRGQNYVQCSRSVIANSVPIPYLVSSKYRATPYIVGAKGHYYTYVVYSM